MNSIKTYWLPAIFILFASCSEHIVVSDADSLGLRFKVKSMSESFYIAYSSFNSIVLHRKIYRHNYQFYHDCRYRSVEKIFYCNTLPCDSISCDSIAGASKSDSVKTYFPHAFKEPGYYFVNYNYVSDSLTTLEFFDEHGNQTDYINRKYGNKRLLSEEKYSVANGLISKSGYWYDSKNKLTNKTTFYKNGYRETAYAYAAGEKYETGDEYNYRYTFDIHGRISNKKTYRGISFVSETCYYYNDYGDIISVHETDRDGIIKKNIYDYEYDSSNNWTTCVEYHSTGNIFVRRREITYYN
ncbi:MAG: hypothetical protein LBQ01_07790 [Prevotellaceae bacterium]|jgi:hypothetical protein|nr:hypothetical protein [Prevotellaceae bacterium]